MMNSEPLDSVTVIIPTHRQVPVGLSSFVKQSKQVWILNNGNILLPKQENLRNIDVPWQGHGRTRQNIISEVETEFVFFSVDDAIPQENMLVYLLQCLQTEDCDAVIARQIPYSWADPITKRTIERWTPNAEKPYFFSQTDHVGTLYRTKKLRNEPFPDVPIAEDAWWSIGKRILCEPRAVIMHSHARKTRDLFLREYQIHKELRKMGREKQSLGLLNAVRGISGNAWNYGFREGIRSTAEFMGRKLAWL